MSWETISVSQCKCACGNGRVYIKHQGDDWNRFRDIGPIVECERCSKQYILKKLVRPSDGLLVSRYYLVPANCDELVHRPVEPPKEAMGRKMSYCDFLIQGYTKTDLLACRKELFSKTSCSSLTGIAREIASQRKKLYRSAKISVLRAEIETALSVYDHRSDNRENAEKKGAEIKEQKLKYEQELIKISFLLEL